MRLSEKTLELNLCSQIATALRRRIIWFGLTQAQEARAGFDVATKLNGRLLIFQFKASNYFVRGARRFLIPHRQLVQLRWRSRRRLRRAVYFVLPLVGTTQEFAANNDLIAQTYLFEPLSLRRVYRPTTRVGTLRVSEKHYLDVVPPNATLHSKPVKAKIISLSQHLRNIARIAPPIQKAFENSEDFMAFRALLPRKSAGMIISNQPTQ